jgi:hypothetical protein
MERAVSQLLPGQVMPEAVAVDQNINPPLTTTQRPFSIFCTCVTVDAR